MRELAKIPVPKEFLGAFKRGHRHHSRDFIDEDFAWRLLKRAQAGCEESRQALEWLTKFNNEYHKGVVHGESRAGALHHTEEMRRDCDQRLYRGKNDLYSIVPLVKKLTGL